MVWNRDQQFWPKQLNKKEQLKIGFINAQSAIGKYLSIKDYVFENDLDVLYIAETWLNENRDEAQIGDMTPIGYRFKQTHRMLKIRVEV